MSIGSIAQSIWSSATTALMSPTAATTAVSTPSTNANGSSASNATTGSSNPFQALSSDLQAWLNQNQSSVQQQSQPQVHHHRHGHHGGGMDQAIQSYANTDGSALSAVPQSQAATA